MDIRTFAAIAAGRKWINKKRQEQKAAQEQQDATRRSGKAKATTLKSAFLSIIFLALFLVYLAIEIMAALAVYMYISIYHNDVFQDFIELAEKFLKVFTTYITQLYPNLANQNFSVVFEEIAPKSIILLLLGFAVSATTRFMAWLLSKLRRYSSTPKSLPPQEPAGAT